MNVFYRDKEGRPESLLPFSALAFGLFLLSISVSLCVCASADRTGRPVVTMMDFLSRILILTEFHTTNSTNMSSHSFTLNEPLGLACSD